MSTKTPHSEIRTNAAVRAVVSREEWLIRRIQLLEKEKAATRLHDQIAAERMTLPCVRIDKNYRFDGPNGRETLADLFAGRSQLIIYHFMFGPGWKEGCVGCSFLSDHFDGPRTHLENHDVSFAVVSRAPFDELAVFKKRMGWGFHWVSSFGSDFNYDFDASYTNESMAQGPTYNNYQVRTSTAEGETSGTSAFYKDANGDIYHTYSTYARGCEPLVGTYALLDMAPLGRNETGPTHNLTDWVRHHDRYQHGGHVAPDGRYVAPDAPCCNHESPSA